MNGKTYPLMGNSVGTALPRTTLMSDRAAYICANCWKYRDENISSHDCNPMLDPNDWWPFCDCPCKEYKEVS